MQKRETAQLTKSVQALLKTLNSRNRDIVSRRFGLSNGKRETLEAIGSSYGITRERVRQIEEFSLKNLTKVVGEYPEIQHAVAATTKTLQEAGGILAEPVLFESVTGSAQPNATNAALRLSLVLAGQPVRFDESDQYRPFWAVTGDHGKQFQTRLGQLIQSFAKHGEPVAHEAMAQFVSTNRLDNQLHTALTPVLTVSKQIGKNIFNQIGLTDWSQIHPRGVRDKAHLVLKRNTKPLHFTEIAKAIGKAGFPDGRKVNTQTVHNELIKDKRFVLVGRGLYGLSEWGYKPGTVKEVLVDIIRSNTPMTRDQLVAKVQEARLVKANTIILNLQDSRRFTRRSDGTYVLRSA